MPEVTPETLLYGLIWFVVFLFSTTCHEAAHALVAKLGGDTTAARQVTIDPRPHIEREKFGMVVVPLLSYFLSGWMMGWASAPYNAQWAYRYPHRAARMALAGPAANFTLMLVGALIIRVGLALDWFQPPEQIASYEHITRAVEQGSVFGLVAVFASILFLLNLLLGTFNLLPVPPLDGNAGVMIFMTESNARRFMEMSHQQGFAMMGILLAWAVFFRLFDVIYTFALNVLYFQLAHYG